MPKIELSVTDEEKAMLRYAADAQSLKLATWGKAELMRLARKSLPVQVAHVQITRNDDTGGDA